MGLDGAGKDTILLKLRLAEALKYLIPVPGFNVASLTNKNISLKMFDLGGPEEHRNAWRNYLPGTRGTYFSSALYFSLMHES